MLEARGLTVAPPGRREPVVSGLDLSLARGEWLAVSGRNGGGKTTLALALAGLLPARTGSLAWCGRPIGPGHDPAARAGVACVLQDPSSQMLESSVGAEIAIGARHAGLEGGALEASVGEWASRFGLEGELDREPRALSAGSQQRVLLAAALASKPALLVLDEPAAHLDAGWRETAIAEVDRARSHGAAILWVTQDARERAAAGRDLELEAAPGRPLPPAAALDPGPARWRVELSPASASEGPRVTVRSKRSFELGARGVTALEGPNGAGKSALLAALAGLYDVAGVRVEREAEPLAPTLLTLQYPELQVFEEHVADELAFAAVTRGDDRARDLARAEAAFRRLGLDGDWLGRRTWELSTGEKRLVELVAALVAPAEPLLLDEPTAGLDPVRRAALAALVVERARGGPVVVASQDADWVAAVAGVRVRLGG